MKSALIKIYSNNVLSVLFERIFIKKLESAALLPIQYNLTAA